MSTKDWPTRPPTADEVRSAWKRETAGSREPYAHPPFPFSVRQDPGSWAIWVPLRATDQAEAVAMAWAVWLKISQGET